MKRIVLFSFLFGFLSSVAYAQDDMYFTPKKVDKSAESTQPEDKSAVVYYSSSSRDVDEYNRRGQYADNYSVMGTDTLISDVIVLDNDTAYSVNADSDTDAYYSYDPDEDYRYSRCMSRFDDFYWYNPWYYDWYWPYGWYGAYGWYGSPYWYAGLWYDPWFYGWHRPWGWYYPSYWYGSYYRPYRGVTGTMNHGRIYGHNSGTANNFKGYRGTTNSSRVNYNQNTINRNDKNNSTN